MKQSTRKRTTKARSSRKQTAISEILKLQEEVRKGKESRVHFQILADVLHECFVMKRSESEEEAERDVAEAEKREAEAVKQLNAERAQRLKVEGELEDALEDRDRLNKLNIALADQWSDSKKRIKELQDLLAAAGHAPHGGEKNTGVSQ